jgi:hypothetical protein
MNGRTDGPLYSWDRQTNGQMDKLDKWTNGRQAGRMAGGKVGRKADWPVGRQENKLTKFDIWSFKKVNTH